LRVIDKPKSKIYTMKKTFYSTLLAAFMLAFCMPVMSQVSFSNSNSKLTTQGFHSGCPVTVTDWNGDGLDDIIRLDQGHDCYVEVQQTNQSYLSVHLGDFGGGAWAMSVADIDKNGYVDVIADGSLGIGVLKTNANGTGGTMTWLANSGFFLQNATFGDFNNDGWIDIFCCDDNAPSHIYLNDGAGNLNPSTIIDFDITPGSAVTSDDSGNYGSVFTDFDNDGDMDLYIAKCRQVSTSTTDPRRIDVLFVNDGNNNYTNMASTYGVANGWQTWTASFGDLDNDGDLDLVATNHDHESQIFENDGTGHYTDITSATGFDITDITPIECVIADLNNDGYNDIMAAGSDNRVYLNNGNMTFTRANGLFDNNSMESFAIGDLNHDGSVDVYASYATIYTNPSSINDVIWLNNRNSNHFISLSLTGTLSNVDAIGARANVYSSLGNQVAEVRAGESYGTCNSSQLHFGLGSLTAVDSIVVRWPSGATQTLYNPQVDQFISITEGQCVSPPSAVAASGPLVLCPGQNVVLTAPAGYSYLWSDGSTNQTLTITSTGEYAVQVTDAGNACVGVSPTFNIINSPNQTPVIAASSAVEFCDGSSVDLLAPAGALAYLWSDGSTTQNITVSTSGNYSLVIQGFCQMWSSNSIGVTVHTAIPPSASGVTLPAPGSTTLNATGNNIEWYDAASGGNLMATGNAFNTPFLNNTTNYFVESAEVYSKTEPVGIPEATDTYSPNGTAGDLIFSVTHDCILNSVKTYTDLAGLRIIELRDAVSAALIDSESVFISPDSQIVNLNFALAAGGNYTLSTNTGANLAMWGNNGPRLRRNNSGVSYPYTIPGVLSITGSALGSNVYYYFYDWQVFYESRCSSARLPVTVTITGTTGIDELVEAGINIYPNPAADQLHIDLNQTGEYTLTLADQSGRIVKNEMLNRSSLVSLKGIAAGMYNLRLQNNNQLINYKVVVQ
jgi:hypothetical protein